MASILRKLAAEPLVHFVLLGAVLFGLDGAFGASAPAERRLIVGPNTRAALAEDWERSPKRPPSEDELEAAVTRWVGEEILYREGLARGLDREDPRVRERVITKMARMLREGVLVPEPTEEELRAFFEEHRDRFGKQPLVDFTQVFVSGVDDVALARANELLASLRAGADPAGMGDTFQGGRRYRRRKIEDLAATFGEEFALGLDVQHEGTWERRRSKHGFHLVRVDRRTSEETVGFEGARLDVEKLWKDTRRDEGVARAIAELRSKWSVSIQ